MKNNTLKEAKRLAKLGISVHWLWPNSKAPISNDWTKLSTLTPEQLERSMPSANSNLGVRLGEHSKVGDYYLYGIDMDIRVKGVKNEAYEALSHLLPDYEELPSVISGSGGESRHFYFLHDELLTTAVGLAKSDRYFRDEDGKRHREWEIDLFSTGKQMALPPSIHPDTGKPYKWSKPLRVNLDLGVGPFIHDVRTLVPIENKVAPSGDEDGELLGLAGLKKPLGLELSKIESCLYKLDEEWYEDYELWTRTGMAINHETEGSDDGFEIYKTFSKQSAKYKSDRDLKNKWGSFNRSKKPITFATILKEVGEFIEDSAETFEEIVEELEKCESHIEAVRLVASSKGLSHLQLEKCYELIRKISNKEALPVSRAIVAKAVKIEIDNIATQTALKRAEDGKRFIDHWGVRMFCAKNYPNDSIKMIGKSFWVYEDGYWQEEYESYIQRKIDEFVDSMVNSSSSTSRELMSAIDEAGVRNSHTIVDSFVKTLKNKTSSSSSDDAMGLLKPANKTYINMKDCEVWFDKHGDIEIREQNPANKALSACPVTYQEFVPSRLWERTLRDIFRDHKDPKGTIALLQELFGYVIQESRNDAVAIMFKGAGGNGKSLIANVLCAILGDSGSTRMSLANMTAEKRSQFATYDFVGRKLAIEDDYPERVFLPSDIIKEMATGVRMNAQAKYGMQFNFTNRAVPMILTNSWPRTSDMSDGLTRRLKVFEFNRQFEVQEMDLMLESKLTTRKALQGIINWAIEGFQRYLTNGRKFTNAIDCEEALDRWLSGRNNLAMFISQEVKLTGNKNDTIKCTDMYDSYVSWCQENGYDNRHINKRPSFYEAIMNLKGVGHIDPRKKRSYHFTGLQCQTLKDLLED